MSLKKQKIYLKDYTPPNFAVDALQLDFSLCDEEVIVKSLMQCRRLASGNLRLNGDELEIIDIAIDNNRLDDSNYQLDGGDIIIPNCPDEFSLTVKTRLEPHKNSALSGLYRSSSLFCTQCEAEGFRRITLFPDRPDVLTTYTTRIEADKEKYPVLLSNGNLTAQGETNGRHWVEWSDPYPKPSYLFALVAGNLECLEDTFTTCSGKKVALKIYVEPGNTKYCQHAMESLKKAMRWDEEKFGREYDLDIFMIVAVSDFNMGAMENKGLNIFNDKYILASPATATDVDYKNIESVVAHEYFHNWTGNRITCRDWFQLSLKEGLTVFRDQEFSRDMHSRAVNRIGDVRMLKMLQFPEDTGAMAHPVQPKSYEEINNFYTATVYEKGAEVIRMQHTLLGESGFRKGMDLYFERYDGQAVTIEEFVSAMEDANKVDLNQFRLWYTQAGTPHVSVQASFKDETLELNFQQSCRETAETDTKKPFHIPLKIALFKSTGEPVLDKQMLVELKQSKQTIAVHGLSERPIVSLLRDFSAPVTVEDDLSFQDRLVLMRAETDGFSRWNASQTLMKRMIQSWYQDSQAPEKNMQTFFTTCNQSLEQLASEDLSLLAQLITPPDFYDALGSMLSVDVERFSEIRKTFCQRLGLNLFDNLINIYTNLLETEDHSFSADAFSRRALRNTCLSLMVKGNESRALNTCLEQFNSSKTMTDQWESFTLLVGCRDDALSADVLSSFYKQWQTNSLVIDKWFSAQATADRADALQRVEKLLSHPDFTFKNPNRVRSLIGAFCQANLKHFHCQDGSGYQFLADMVCKIDTINPQIAARLMTPFTRTNWLDDSRQAKIQEILTSLNKKQLSADVSEILKASLEVA